MIDPEHPRLSIQRQCRLVSISRSAFYYQAAGETPLNLELMRLFDAQFLETPWYGSRQMARCLRRQGYTIGRKRVRRLMAKMDLAAIYQAPRTTIPHLSTRLGVIEAGRSPPQDATATCRARSKKMAYFVGLDVSKDETAICVRDDTGGIALTAKVPTDPVAICGRLASLGAPPVRVILETGRMSNWLHQSLVALGLSAVCVDARQAHAVLSQMHNKTDANDAAMLAELARTGFYRPVTVKGRSAQEGRTLLQARDLMIRQRMDLDNTVRGLLASLGVRLPRARQAFAERVHEAVESDAALMSIIKPLLRARAALMAAKVELDRKLLSETRSHPSARRLMSVPGVGAVTAFAFIATIDDPTRFRSSRAVGAYLGLTPRRYQSGERDVTGRISKRGDRTMRTLLYEAAMSLITRVKPAKGGSLQAWARALRDRVGHKKACVALARRIGVLLHRIWVNGTTFELRTCGGET